MATIGPTTSAGNDHRERAFGQEAERRRQRRAEQPVPGARHAVADGHQRRGDGHGDTERQGQVGQRHPGEHDVAETGRDDRPGDERRVVVVPAPRQTGGDEHQGQTRQRRPQPPAGRARAGHRVGRGGEPVVENRLLEARLVVVGRCQPVARLDHLAGGFGVERLVGIGDRRRAEPDEERQARDHEQRGERTSHVPDCSGSSAARSDHARYTRRDGNDQGAAERLAARRGRRRDAHRLERHRVHAAETPVRVVPLRGIDAQALL